LNAPLKIAIFLYVLTITSVCLNVILLRQVVGFIYLSFVPGYLFLSILRHDKRDLLETVLFSVGTSIAFLMFAGLFLNMLFLALNLCEPLSIVPLMIVITGLTIILLVLSYKQKDKEGRSLSFGKLSAVLILKSSLIIMLPVLAVVGAMYHITSLLLIMILAITFICMASVFSNRLLPEKIFPLVLASVSIALLLHTALISKYFIGSDIFSEFYVFKLTETESFWHPPGLVSSYSLIDSLNSVLSITILPMVYRVILGINGEVFFKIFYPFVFSLTPLVLYKIYESQTEKKVAFTSAFVLISTSIAFFGIEPLSLARQMTGQFFFILSMYLIIEKRLNLRRKRILLIIFAAALIVSHYSMAYLFLAYILFLFIFSRLQFSGLKISANHSVKALNVAVILLISVLTFSWYIYISSSPLNQLSNSIYRITRLISVDLFNFEARTQQKQLTPLFQTVSTSTIGMVHKVLVYLQLFFIAIGAMVMALKPKKFNLNFESRLAAMFSIIILGSCFIIPNFAVTLNATRFYSIVVPFLTPLYAFGCIFLLDLAGRFFPASLQKLGRVHVKNLGLYVAACLLILTFLFQVGFVNHVANDYPYSYSLDLDRKEKASNLEVRVIMHSQYFFDQDVFSTQWLRENMNSELKVYADANSRSTLLKSYALLSDDKVGLITNGSTFPTQTYVYLRYVNIQLGLVSTPSLGFFNITDLSSALIDCNKIYSDGDSEVYFAP